MSAAVDAARPSRGREIRARAWTPGRSLRGGRSGVGLGLAIVAAIVEAHDGTVRAANAPGGGASFVGRLPPAQG